MQLRPAAPLNTGAIPLDVGTYAIPCVADWNGDGRKDLLVGYRTADKIAVYLNTGTDAQPTFTNFYNLQADGADIYVAGSSCGAPAPWVCDFDADGRRDLLVGNGANGTVLFYRNTNTDAAPRLVAQSQLAVGSGALSVSSRATPYVHDWDEDGLPDLLCGSGGGSVYYFRNTNSVRAPIFAQGVLLQAGGTTLNLGIRSVARIVDWDGDGLKDLVGSSDSGAYWCRNTNRNHAPTLQSPVALRAPVSGIGLTAIQTGGRMRLDLSDWNNDGVPDLLLGNLNGTVYFYEGYRFAVATVEGTPANEVRLAWASAPFLKYNLEARPTLNAAWSPLTNNLPSGGTVTRWTNHWDAGDRYYRLSIAP